MDVPAAKRLKVDELPSSSHKRDEGAASQMFYFSLERLEDFNQPFPSYRQPVEIGHFSVNSDRKMLRSKSQLKFYSAPKKLNLPLSAGFDSYVGKKDSRAEGIKLLLEWITHNSQCFRPQTATTPNNGKGATNHLPAQQHKSERKYELLAGVQNQLQVCNFVWLGRQENPTFPPALGCGKPDNILTDFITWRGLLTKIMITPFNRNEAWAFVATKYNGTIYLKQLQTEQERLRYLNETQRDKLMTYWGHKFEDYMTTSTAPATIRDSSSGSGDPVNPNLEFVTVARTRINTHSIVMGAEVDCCDHGSKEQSPRNYIELKTSRFIFTDRNKYSFKKFKLLKWWAQSFLVGVPKIVCGFRDDDGNVTSLEHFKTIEIPREVDMQQGLWDPAICLNFFDKFLTWLKTSIVLQDNSRVIYLIQFTPPLNQITAEKLTDITDEHTILPDWYLNKETPPDC